MNMNKILLFILISFLSTSAFAISRDEIMEVAKKSLVKAFNDSVRGAHLDLDQLSATSKLLSGENVTWSHFDRLKMTTYFEVRFKLPCEGFDSKESESAFKDFIQINKISDPTVGDFAADIECGIAVACCSLNANA
jgi:hypothetical protein